jgi:hypothetical protein
LITNNYSPFIVHRLFLFETLGFWILFDIWILSFELYTIIPSKSQSYLHSIARPSRFGEGFWNELERWWTNPHHCS